MVPVLRVRQPFAAILRWLSHVCDLRVFVSVLGWCGCRARWRAAALRLQSPPCSTNPAKIDWIWGPREARLSATELEARAARQLLPGPVRCDYTESEDKYASMGLASITPSSLLLIKLTLPVHRLAVRPCRLRLAGNASIFSARPSAYCFFAIISVPHDCCCGSHERRSLCPAFGG